MILHTKHVEALPGYRLYVQFDNGVAGEVQLLDELWGEMFEPLKDEELFATAKQDDTMGTVVWSNGADMAPEHLLDLLTKQSRKAA